MQPPKLPTWHAVRLDAPIGRVSRIPNWSRTREDSLRLPDHEFWLVTAGSGWLATRTARLSLRPGFFAWMRPGGIYDAGQDEAHPISITYIHFSLLNSRLQTLPTKSSAPAQEFWHLPDLTYFESAAHRIVDLFTTRRPAALSPSPLAPAAQLLSALLQDILHLPQPQNQIEPLLHQNLRAIAAEIRSHPHRPVRVAELARRLHITSAHFSRTFAALLGKSPQNYAIDARLQRARHLLTESSLPITAIARSLGYSSPAFFSRQFHHHLGIPPSTLRRPQKDF